MKVIKFMGNLVVVTGVIMIILTAGQSDMYQVEFMEILSNVLFGCIMISFGRLLCEVSKLRFVRKRNKCKIIQFTNNENKRCRRAV